MPGRERRGDWTHTEKACEDRAEGNLKMFFSAIVIIHPQAKESQQSFLKEYCKSKEKDSALGLLGEAHP